MQIVKVIIIVIMIVKKYSIHDYKLEKEEDIEKERDFTGLAF